METKHDRRIRYSIKEYAATLAVWGWLVIACTLLGDIVTVALSVWAIKYAPVPEGAGPWIWIVLALVITVQIVVPFIAFHKQRIAHIDQLESVNAATLRQDMDWKEKNESILRDRNLASSIATEHINRLQNEIVSLKSEIASLRDAHEFRHALSFANLRREDHPEGGTTIFRIEVRNINSHRTVEDVCIRVVGLARIDRNNMDDLLSNAKPLLAITGTGNVLFNPPEVRRNLVAGDSVLFDFVNVQSDRSGGHSLCYGECVEYHMQQGRQMYQRTHNHCFKMGKYRVTIDVQGRNVVSIPKEFVFWGDKTGTHCLEVNDPSLKIDQPLEFATIDLETLPADMHHHQLDALKTELQRSVYNGMDAKAVYWQLHDDGIP